MKILVTGATGFIGSEIVNELIKNNYQVVSIGRSESNINTADARKTFVFADITDQNSLKKLESLEGIDSIIHSAGLAHQFGDTKKEEFDSVNVRGTENVLNLGIKLGIKQFILIGSTAVYGTKKKSDGSFETTFDEESTLNPQTLYAESKLEGERVCIKICEDNQIPLTVLRLAPVIGENNVGNVSRLISSIDKNRFLWIGSGKNMKSLIYKTDVARAVVLLLEHKKTGIEIFNLAAEPVQMKQFVERIAAKLNKKILPIGVPPKILRIFFGINSKSLKLNKVKKLSETVEKWLSDDIYPADKIFERYKFKAETPILQAVEKQVEYYRLNK